MSSSSRATPWSFHSARRAPSHTVKKILHEAGMVVVSALVLAAPALAQPVNRAVRSTPATGQDLSLSLDITEAYDQDVATRLGGVPIPLFQGSGPYTMLTPQLDFQTHGGRVQLGLTAGSSVRYYQNLHEVVAASHTAGLGFTAALTPQTSLSVGQNLGYSPALFNGLFASVAAPTPGNAESPSSNYLLGATQSFSSGTTAGLTHKFTPRAALLVRGSYHYDHFTGDNPGYSDVQSQEAGGRFTYSMSRGVQLRLGYTFKQGEYLGSPKTTEHNSEVGVDYIRVLSRTRKTTLAFSLGPTWANGALQAGPLQNQVSVITGAAVGSPITGSALDVRKQFRVVGDASLVHQLNRTWDLKGTYHRGLGYIEGFTAPVFSAAYAASAGGLLSRRTDLSLSAAYSTGESALVGVADQFTTYTGDARLRFMVNKVWATYVEYLFYYYEFGPGISLPPGVPPGLTRNGVRVGLTMLMPVMRHR